MHPIAQFQPILDLAICVAIGVAVRVAVRLDHILLGHLCVAANVDGLCLLRVLLHTPLKREVVEGGAERASEHAANLFTRSVCVCGWVLMGVCARALYVREKEGAGGGGREGG